MFRCPGQDQRFWKPDDIFDIECPGCGITIEFWKDEPKVKCPGCKRFVNNPRLDMGCAKWCKYAAQCLGAAANTQGSDLCSRLIAEMREIFAADNSRINHALKTLMYAESIQTAQGGEPLVVKAAAILHEVSIGDVAQILKKHGVEPQLTEKICAIISPLSLKLQGAGLGEKTAEYLELKILSDAHKLADFQTAFAGLDKNTASARIAASFETPQGRKLANQLLADM